MVADALLLYGSIIGIAIFIWAGVKLGFALSTPARKPPTLAQRFRKLWYCESTRRIYGEVWQQGVWYEISYCGVHSTRCTDPDSHGLHRFDGGLWRYFDGHIYAVLHALWWQQNSGDTDHVRRYLDLLLKPDRKRP